MGAAARIHAAAGGSKRALTLLEVVLAVALSVMGAAALAWFYASVTATRRVVLEQSEQLASLRGAMDRICDEVRTSTFNVFTADGMFGREDQVRFLIPQLPSPATWLEVGAMDQPPPPEAGVQEVTYRLLTWEDEHGELHVEGLQRQINRMPAATIVEFDEDAASLWPAVKFINLRYYDGVEWLSEWAGGGNPMAVEITLGVQPLVEGEDPLEYDAMAQLRRVVYVPSAAWAGGAGAVGGRGGQRDDTDGDAPGGGRRQRASSQPQDDDWDQDWEDQQ